MNPAGLSAGDSTALEGSAAAVLSAGDTSSSPPHAGCLLVSSSLDAGAVLGAISEVVGFEFPEYPGTVSTDFQALRALWLTPRSWLLQCPLAREEALAREFDDAFPDKRVHAALYSDQLSWFVLSGPQSLDLLCCGGFVSLEREGLGVGRVKRSNLAGIEALILREQPEVWCVAVDRSRARYLASWLAATREADLQLRGI